MTQLFIEGTEVVLPENLSVELHVFNPVITSEGTVTYDIDLDLRNQRNAKLYRHLDRINAAAAIKDRRAELRCDGRTILVGREIILKTDAHKVKIQLVGGNSEFNYDVKDTSMQDLDLGEIIPQEGTTVTPEEAMDTLDGCWPEHNHVYTPILMTYELFPISQRYNYTEGPDDIDHIPVCVFHHSGTIWNSIRCRRYEENYFQYDTDVVLCPQPYLLYYVRKVLEAMGYEITLNTLEADVMNRRIYVVNGNRTLKYNEMVPNWTVEKFIDEVEKFFNVIIKVDNFEKKVQVVQSTTYYATTDKIFINPSDIIDEFERTFASADKSPSYSTNYDNVKYNFPSTDWYKYADIDRKLLPHSGYGRTYDFSQVEYEAQQIRDGKEKEYYNLLKFFHTRDAGIQVITKLQIEGRDAHTVFPHIVDQFCGEVVKDSSQTTTLNIIPAEVMSFMNEYFYAAAQKAGHYLSTALSAIPFCRRVDSPSNLIAAYKTDFADDEEDNQELRPDGTTVENGINEYILSGKPSETVPEQMAVAFYAGVQQMRIIEEQPMIRNNQELYPTAEMRQWVKWPLSLSYPMVSSHNIIPGRENQGDTCQEYDSRFDLSPKYRKQHYYANVLHFDAAVEYVVRFRTRAVLDASKIFIIHSRQFYCKELKYVLRYEGFDPIVEGTFYPVDN